MAENYFQVDKISVKYGDIQVLWDISFEAAKGEIIALVVSWHKDHCAGRQQWCRKKYSSKSRQWTCKNLRRKDYI